MSDVILPCLEERNWQSRELATCSALCAGDDSPLVAFGYDHPDAFEFITTEMFTALGITRSELDGRALANLRARPASWQLMSAEIEGQTLATAICTDDFFAAEHLLDPAFMQDAQRRLGVPALMVGVPRRGVLMAASSDLDERLAAIFRASIEFEFAGAESAVISPLVFTVKDGAIISPSTAAAKRPRPPMPASPPAMPAPEETERPPMFQWWTNAPAWFRIFILFVIGMVILNRILIEMVSRWIR